MNGKISYLLDTNIVLGFLNGYEPVETFFRLQLLNKPIFLSQITRLELLGFHGITKKEESSIQQFLSLTTLLPIDEIVCQETITLRRLTRLKLPDAIIAATAKVNKLTLATADEAFVNVTQIKIIKP